MMKILVWCCALTVASAGYASPYYYNQVPAETPEVQVAKSLHFAAHAAAKLRTGPYAGLNSLYGYAGVAHSGQPLDTPEVAAAKLQHYHDYNVAAQRNGVYAPYAIPLTASHPIDTPEVQLAKAAHFAAHAEATARNAHGAVHYRRRRGIYSPYPQHVPVIDHNGVPLDTPEVSAAKAQHFAEHARVSGYGPAHIPVVSAYTYPQHVPAIGPNGVPLDTPEVQQAKAQHFAALAGRGGHYISYGPPAEIGHDGQPVETYEVRAAKAAHFAAHANAKAQNLHY